MSEDIAFNTYSESFIATFVVPLQGIGTSFTFSIIRMWYCWNMFHAFVIAANGLWPLHWAQTLLFLSGSGKNTTTHDIIMHQFVGIPLHLNDWICIFQILDEVYSVINYIRITPPFGRPYKITEELIDLSTMAMEYFKDHLEPTMPQFGMISKDFLEGVNSKCIIFDYFICQCRQPDPA